MIPTVHFLLALIWGTLAASFLMQIITSGVITIIYIAALGFSKVKKRLNAFAALFCFLQTVFFTALLIAGTLFVRRTLDYTTPNFLAIVTLISFMITILSIAPEMPGKITLAQKSAWVLDFFESAKTMSAKERIAYAKKHSTQQPHV